MAGCARQNRPDRAKSPQRVGKTDTTRRDRDGALARRRRPLRMMAAALAGSRVRLDRGLVQAADGAGILCIGPTIEVRRYDAQLRERGHDLRTVLPRPELKSRLEDFGTYIRPTTPEELTAYIREQQAIWRPVIAETAKKIN